MQRTLLILFLVLIQSACSSRIEDTTKDQFYRYTNKEGVPAFSFILRAQPVSDRSHEIIRKDSASSIIRTPDSQNETPLLPKEADEDARTSVKFRMEELAFQKLDKKLEKENYCKDGYQVVESDFQKLKYIIKGVCKQSS